MNISRKRRILFVEQNQDGTIGGSHHSLLVMLKALDKDKFEPIVLFYEHVSILEDYQKFGRCIVYPKPLGMPLNIKNRVLRRLILIFSKSKNFVRTSISPISKFVSIIIKEKIDLIHLNNNSFYSLEWLVAAKFCGRKCISHQRGTVTAKRFGAIIARKFDKIVCISKFIEKDLSDNGVRNNTVVIYNAIDVEEFRSKVSKTKTEIRKEFGIDNESPLVGMVGNFQRWKGQETVVNAVSGLKYKYPNIICLLIGGVSDTFKADIDYYKMIDSLIKENELTSNIVITGYRKDIADLINALDIQIHASTHPEPFGRVIIEGMCLGKPIIATDMGGPQEILKNNYSGILVKPNSPRLLLEKIEYLIDNADVTSDLQKNALESVSTQFGLEKFSSEINQLYTTLLTDSQ